MFMFRLSYSLLINFGKINSQSAKKLQKKGLILTDLTSYYFVILL